jgi:hypothetical protein
MMDGISGVFFVQIVDGGEDVRPHAILLGNGLLVIDINFREGYPLRLGVFCG